MAASGSPHELLQLPAKSTTALAQGETLASIQNPAQAGLNP